MDGVIVDPPLFVFEYLKIGEYSGGVGGIRTRVQTSDKKAFYKFRFRLIFESALTENCLYRSYHHN